MTRVRTLRKVLVAAAILLGSATTAQAQSTPATAVPAAAAAAAADSSHSTIAAASVQRVDHRDATGTQGSVVRVAAAASGAMSQLGAGFGSQSRESTAEPPALLIYLAGLLVILFVSTRRRKDDR